MKISIFGLGYVGSVSTACFAAMGHKVIGVDIKEEKNNKINSGESPVFEKGLDKLLRKGINDGKIFATMDTDFAIKNSEVSLVCVGTPSLPDGNINLKYVSKVCEDIGISLSSKDTFHTIIIRSTIPPGTINEILVPLIQKTSGKNLSEDFGIVMNPEFLREGTAIEDFFSPEIIVIGACDQKCFDIASDIYTTNSKYKVEAEKEQVSVRLAELVKYVFNSYHALKVAFANEIGVISKELKVDSQELMRIFCKEKKTNISPYYFRPGFSFGGSCLPKDLKGLNKISSDLEILSPILSSIISSNDIHTDRAVELISKTNIRSIAFLGLSFKADTDDIRNNPIISVIDNLSKDPSYDLYIYDDIAKIDNLFREKNITVIKNIDDMPEEVSLLVLSNNSKQYHDFVINSNKIVIDLNKCLSGEIDTLCIV